MDETRALAILSALANGVNPLTGEVFPADSPYQSVDVIRALYRAVRSLESASRRRVRGTPAYGNAGKPWTEDEDRRLLAQFDRGCPLAELARAHARTRGGIQARLIHHGRMHPSFDARSSLYRRSAGDPLPSRSAEPAAQS